MKADVVSLGCVSKTQFVEL